MVKEAKIIACADPSKYWGNVGEAERIQKTIDKSKQTGSGPALNWQLTKYSSLAQLITNIRIILLNDPDIPSLKTLEIHGHGSGSSVDGITSNNVTSFGQDLKNHLVWSDSAEIYLSGCNTSLYSLDNLVDPINKQLAEAMPIDPGRWEHHITVYGSCGYLFFSHCEGKEFTKREVDYIGYHFGPSIGGIDMKGSSCWNARYNW